MMGTKKVGAFPSPRKKANSIVALKKQNASEKLLSVKNISSQGRSCFSRLKSSTMEGENR
jgi:hypothetical protein